MLYMFRRREFGLEKFVPISLMESMKRKELRKLLTHLLKLNQTMTGTNYKTLTALQAKLYYLTIISELPSYGAKCFSTNVRVSVLLMDNEFNINVPNDDVILFYYYRIVIWKL